MKAIQVAVFFIDLFNKENKYMITNLKLNKLLYFSQGWFLARYHKPLFIDNPIEAWDLGPVVSNVYQAYKPFGKNHINVDGNEDFFVEDTISTEELELLIDIYNNYSEFTGNELVAMTHQKGTPWNKVYEKNKNNVIPNELIEEYFSKQDKIPSVCDIDYSKIDTIGRIDKDGHLVLPTSERDN